MSESKTRLQRENDRLRRVEADHALLLAAARKAARELRGLIDKDVGTKTLEDALGKMPAPAAAPTPPPAVETPSRRGRSGRALMIATAAMALSCGIGGRR